MAADQDWDGDKFLQSQADGKRAMTSPTPKLPDREAGAKIIYDAFPFDGKHPSGVKPEWTPGGNSDMQNKARATFDALLSSGLLTAPVSEREANLVEAARAVIDSCGPERLSAPACGDMDNLQDALSAYPSTTEQETPS